MKLNTICRFTALGTALALSVTLAGCGATANASSTAETASSETASSEAASGEAASGAGTTATVESAWANIADFKFSEPFDDNGYFKDVKALDYVTLPDNFAALPLPAGTDKLSDTAVSDYITENILSSYTTTNQVKDRAAVDGDTVNIDYVGSIDGVEFEGGNSGGKGSDLTLGSGRFIPGFEDQIVGHTPGESFNVTATFPDDYSTTDLAGKEAVFATTLNYISEEVAPELTDAWVAENVKESTGAATVAELQDYVGKNLLYQQESQAVYTALDQSVTYADKLPQAVTDFARSYYVYQMYAGASQYGVDLATMLSANGYGSVEEYLTAADSSLQSQAQQWLLVQAIAESLGLKCDDASLAQNMKEYYGTTDTTKFTDFFGTNFVKSMTLGDVVVHNLVDTAVIAAE